MEFVAISTSYLDDGQMGAGSRDNGKEGGSRIKLFYCSASSKTNLFRLQGKA